MFNNNEINLIYHIGVNIHFNSFSLYSTRTLENTGHNTVDANGFYIDNK